jgi:hypothetical protein
MSFIQRELEKIESALREPRSADWDQLFAAQQALAWALDPHGFKPPSDTIRPGTQEGSVDCPSSSYPSLS